MKQLPWILLCAAISVIAVLLLKDGCNKKPEVVSSVDSSVIYWKNKYGQSIASQKKTEEAFSMVMEGFLDSIARLHNTRASDIKEAVIFAMRGSVRDIGAGSSVVVYEPYPVYVDSNGQCPSQIKSIGQIFSSSWYDAYAELNTNADSSTFELNTYDTISVVWKRVSEGNIFNRREFMQVDFSNANPYNKIINATVYRSPATKQKRFGLGLHLGYGLTANGKPSVVASAGINYTILSIK